METEIDKKIALDLAIRNFEEKIEAGYEIEGTIKENYLSKEAFAEFLDGMSQQHKAQYNDGNGGELYEKKGRYGMNPPKMASFGSSSRFIYLLSKDIPGFEFEKKLPTKVGHTPANLDGYLHEANRQVFVEAKRREIYSSHKRVEVSRVYEPVYDYIKKKSNSLFDFEVIPYNNDYFKCTFKWDNNAIEHFDVKQLICHFLGICADILENHSCSNIHFIYLIFNPNFDSNFDTNFDTNFDDKIKKYDKEIKADYESTTKEVLAMDMECLFGAVMKYQSEKLHLAIPDYSFSFALADQTDYLKKVRP